MTSLSEELTKAIDTKNEKNIVDILTRILIQSEDIELESSDLLKRIINLKNDDITKAFIEVAAEWSKDDQNRKFFTDEEIIKYFLGLLQRSEESVVMGAIRTLGNICYENEDARNMIDTAGLTTIITILQADHKRKNNMLTLKVSGFLVNLLTSHEELQKAALKLNIVEVIENLLNKYIKCFNENQMLFALLTILNDVIDYFEDQGVQFTESLCNIIIDIFKMSMTPEISVICLEILHGQADKDDVKIIMAKRGVCEFVFELIEKYRSQVIDEESRSVLKMACDVIVLVLTEDDCMYLLYNDGQGKLYENMITWLDSDDPDLLSTGILAIGNFARKDTHCIQMVQKGISKKMIEILSQQNRDDGDLKVQHALLSTMKNLVIPQQNKPIVLQEGLIDVIYSMIYIEQYLVVFKLLGTFRMVIDGQEKAALDLISRKEFIERLMYWCYTSEHPGVRGEVPRLLSWLIKHCHSFKPFKTLIQVRDAVRCLVEMVASNHAVMQNESFYALNLLCIGCGISNEGDSTNGVNSDHLGQDGDEALFDQLIDAEIGKNLSFVINKHGDKMDKHTIENLITLLEQLINSSAVVQHLKVNCVGDALTNLSSNPNAQTFKEKLSQLISQINEN